MRTALPLSALFGLAMAATLFPADFLFPAAGLPWRPVGDAAQHAAAQRFFIASPWAWPPLDIGLLGRLNLAFADGIPLLAVPLKLLAPWLPPGFHGIGLWYALGWALLPPAAAWAMAGTGERRWGVLLAVGVAAASMPAFINRYGHAALTGHFLIWLGLGCYLRLVAGRGSWPAAVALQGLTLLVHPYLAVMTLALLAAVPATLLLRGARWWPAALGLAAGVGLVLGLMAGLGYLGADSPGRGGYGHFALNLLSPLWPYGSLFLGWAVEAMVAAPQQQAWEGYNWLGLGLLAALAALLVRARGELRRLARRHAGLLLVLAALTVLAVTTRVGFGPWRLLAAGPPPDALEQFRASGRFFWPVGCALLLGAAALLARRPGGGVLVAALTVVQFLDAQPLRTALAEWAQRRPAWTVDVATLRPLLERAERVVLLPSWVCLQDTDDPAREAIIEMLTLLSETPRAVNTFYAARWRVTPACEDATVAARPPAPGELRLTWDGGWRVVAAP